MENSSLLLLSGPLLSMGAIVKTKADLGLKKLGKLRVGRRRFLLMREELSYWRGRKKGMDMLDLYSKEYVKERSHDGLFAIPAVGIGEGLLRETEALTEKRKCPFRSQRRRNSAEAFQQVNVLPRQQAGQR